MIKLEHAYSGIEIQCWKNGEPATADTTPVCTLFRNGVATNVVVTVASTAQTGRYIASFTSLGTADGWSVDDHIVVRTVATLNTLPYPTISFDSNATGAATQTMLAKVEATTAGTTSGAGTNTEVFVGSEATVTVTLDNDNNRTAVVVS